jgi:hypothetical protein
MKPEEEAAMKPEEEAETPPMSAEMREGYEAIIRGSVYPLVGCRRRCLECMSIAKILFGEAFAWRIGCGWSLCTDGDAHPSDIVAGSAS